jgi:hypothetical protein
MIVSVQKPRKATMSTYVAAPLFATIAKDMSALLQPDGTLFITNPRETTQSQTNEQRQVNQEKTSATEVSQ